MSRQEGRRSSARSPFVSAPEVRERIVAERVAGSTWAAIAAGLNRDQVATSQGGVCWYPSSVRAACLATAPVG